MLKTSVVKNIGLTCAVLACSFFTPLSAHAEGVPSEFTALNKEQQEAVNDMIHQFIMKNPEVLLESVELYQMRLEEEKTQKAQQASKTLVSDILAKNVDVPVAGNTEPDILVVEFLDYNCGYCKRGFETVQDVLEIDNAQVAFIDLPVLGNSSREAAKYALAAKLQGKYFEFHTALFEKPSVRSEAGFLEVAADLGLDADKLKADANGKEVQALLDQNRELADKLGVSGTPAFIVGEEFVPGYIPFSSMEPMIKAQLEK